MRRQILNVYATHVIRTVPEDLKSPVCQRVMNASSGPIYGCRAKYEGILVLQNFVFHFDARPLTLRLRPNRRGLVNFLLGAIDSGRGNVDDTTCAPRSLQDRERGRRT
jgi:hypothetical protein